jgi:LmbE family N-acetylglucosaminyl deacetylase
MNWIYLAPHLDDAVLSCGGIIWEQVQAGNRVEIWTICAGDPPPGPLSAFAQAIQNRWQLEENSPAARRQEDINACRRVGTVYRHFNLPDVIYRWLPDGEPVIKQNNDLWLPYHPAEGPLIQWMCQTFAANLPNGEVMLVSPLTIGGHSDHRLVRAAAEQFGRSLLYYADVPYVIQQPQQLAVYTKGMQIGYSHPVTLNGLVAWQDGVAAYTSQVKGFWSSRAELDAALEQYCREPGGNGLWSLPKNIGSMTKGKP